MANDDTAHPPSEQSARASTAAPAGHSRRPYGAPTLTRLGAVRDLTFASKGSAARDSSFTRAKT